MPLVKHQNGAAGDNSPGVPQLNRREFAQLYGRKKDFAQAVSVSVRTVNSWLGMGLPHLKTSERTVRINFQQAIEWMEKRFRVVRMRKGVAK